MRSVLILGSMRGQTLQRVNAFSQLGYRVTTFSDVPETYFPGLVGDSSRFEKIFWKLGFPIDKQFLNRKVKSYVKTAEALDLVWVEKCLVLRENTIVVIKKYFPSCKICFYSGDDMFASHNQSYFFKRCLPYYDFCFTTKSYNANHDELPALGAKNVFFLDKSYDPDYCRPMAVTKEDRFNLGSDVGFVGSCERHRAEMLLEIARQGVKIRVFGNGWSAYKGINGNLIVEDRPLYGEDFIKSLCATKINLCFLRKANRDLQTDRTMEIPACAAFMLAEDTVEHRRLFKGGVEAVFFDPNSANDLREKILYYLAAEDERTSIAADGYKKIQASKHSHLDRISFALNLVAT